MVARYVLNLRQTAGSGRIVGAAPRLTVFRHAGDDWMVVAHANFGQIEKIRGGGAGVPVRARSPSRVLIQRSCTAQTPFKA